MLRRLPQGEAAKTDYYHVHLLPFNSLRNELSFDMSHATFLKQVGRVGVLKLLPFNSRRNELSFDISHAIFLKNEKTTKWAFFGIKTSKMEKFTFYSIPGEIRFYLICHMPYS